MKNKSYAVIGLGQFGMTVALTLAEANCDVLAIDDKDDNVQDIAEKVSYAVKADVRDPGILESLGVQNVDVAVIAVAENMEASITATMQVKELGVPFVMAKAMNSLHGRILEKIGADKVIYPEHSMGIRVARNLLSCFFFQMPPAQMLSEASVQVQPCFLPCGHSETDFSVLPRILFRSSVFSGKDAPQKTQDTAAVHI